MDELSRKRCVFHPVREAVARCPKCGGFFCRECITEHEGRVLCAACLNAGAKLLGRKNSRWRWLIQPVQFVIGLVMIWLVFYQTGQALIVLPSRFHDGSVWTSNWWEHP